MDKASNLSYIIRMQFVILLTYDPQFKKLKINWQPYNSHVFRHCHQ
jgi:hypothetical protein